VSFSWTRVRAILVKELRDYRRNRFVIGTMVFLPLLFIALPIVQLLTVSASATSSRLDARVGLSLLYLLLIPAIVPSTLSATPTLTIAYVIFGIFLAAAALFAHPGISSAVFAGSHVLVQLLFTPLLAGWSIWVGIASPLARPISASLSSSASSPACRRSQSSP
jgi:hypothetical protein